MPNQYTTERVSPRNMEDRFWEKVEKGRDCWVWKASKAGSFGYGAFSLDFAIPFTTVKDAQIRAGGRPLLLDAFSGAGGAGYGYKLSGFYVVGLDHRPQPHYAGDEFHQADALTFPLDGFDVIHASPPCQGYCKETRPDCRGNHPKLIEEVRLLLMKTGKPYVIENVEGARKFLNRPLKLCGTMFGLPLQRHRFFEIHPRIEVFPLTCDHRAIPVYITGTPRPRNGPRKDPSAETKRGAMNTPWMTIKDMDEAIPPAYTEFIGRNIFKHFKRS